MLSKSHLIRRAKVVTKERQREWKKGTWWFRSELPRSRSPSRVLRWWPWHSHYPANTFSVHVISVSFWEKKTFIVKSSRVREVTLILLLRISVDETWVRDPGGWLPCWSRHVVSGQCFEVTISRVKWNSVSLTKFLNLGFSSQVSERESSRRALRLGGFSEGMAPRRHTNGGGLFEAGNSINQDAMENLIANGHNSNTTRCCTPTGECLRGDALIRMTSLQDVVKVTCNNDSCSVGQFMHRECFDAWEQTVLTYLKSCGRARSWSERQRHQNLWTKKGYDLAFKACGCRCGRGHLKKDLDWMPPGVNNVAGNRQDDNEAKKKKRRNRQNTRPSLAVSAGPPGHGGHVNGGNRGTDVQIIENGRGRAGSLSSSNGSSSPPATSEPSVSPLHQPQALVKKKSKVEFFGDRVR